MSPDATQGCIRTAGDASVDALLGEIFGDGPFERRPPPPRGWLIAAQV
jgi:hypothetical protein